jgi:hypothetical protein
MRYTVCAEICVVVEESWVRAEERAREREEGSSEVPRGQTRRRPHACMHMRTHAQLGPGLLTISAKYTPFPNM